MMTHTRNWWTREEKIGWQRPLLFLACILALVWLVGLLSNPQSVTAQSGTTITLESVTTTINGCETLDVFIRINNVSGLYGADVLLTFDPAVLEVTALQESVDFLLPTFYIARKQWDNTDGTVRLALTQLSPRPPVDGSGNFGRVTFRAKGAQTNSSIQFGYSELATINGVTIPATAVNGSLSTTPPAATTAAIAKLNPTTARLSWTAVPGVSSYNIYRDTYAYFTPTTPHHTTSALTFDDDDALGDVASNNFYVVRSACANGFESANANRVGEFDYPLLTDPATNKFNMIALPLDSTASIVPFRASGLAAYVGSGVKLVQRWNTPTQNFRIYNPVTSPPSANFELSIGGLYVLEVDNTVDQVVTFVGGVPSQGSIVFNFTLGLSGDCTLNSLSIPLDRTDILRASALADDIGGVTQVLGWNPGTQNFRLFKPVISPPSADFTVRTGYPYFVCLDETAPISWP
ncbi:MAG: hypothetical protein IPM39_12530 [Chloroflexi bacterium]|nr:hypothetical protein [Chloroflexota bacterium]